MGQEYNTEMYFGRMPEAIGAKNCRWSGEPAFAAGVRAAGVGSAVLVAALAFDGAAVGP